MNKIVSLDRLGHDINCAGCRINHWSRDHSHFSPSGGPTATLNTNRNSCHFRGKKAGVPEGGRVAPGVVISIESVNAIVHGGNVDDIVPSFARNGLVGQIEWLTDNCTIYVLTKKTSEQILVYVCGCEQLLLSI